MKRFKIYQLTLLVAMIVAAVMMVGCVNPSRRVSSQLDRLDSTDKDAILEWLLDAEEDFPNFRFDVTSLDSHGGFVSTRVLDSSERFEEWTFEIFPGGQVNIDFIYQPIDEFVNDSLSALDSRSLSDILEWKDTVEDDDDLFLSVRFTDLDDNWLSDDALNFADQFVEWEWEIDRFGFLELYLIFDSSMVFNAGDTFEFDNLQITVSDDIQWGLITDTWSSNFGLVYFYTEVTVENIGDSTENISSVRQFIPDGTEMDFLSIRSSESLSGIGQLRPGASQSGYLFFRYEGAGQYVAVFWGLSFDVEVHFDITSSDAPELSLRTIIDDYMMDDINFLLDLMVMGSEDYMEMSFSLRGDNELTFTLTLFDELVAELLPGDLEDLIDYLDDDFQWLLDDFYFDFGIMDITLTLLVENEAGSELISHTWTLDATL